MKKLNTIRRAALAALLSTTGLTGTAAWAETTLASPDGSFEITGELKSVDENEYIIETEYGELIVAREFVTCAGDGCPAIEAETDVDRQIVLSSPDGSVRLEGDLINLTETSYVIETLSGELTVRRELVLCEGEACPREDEVQQVEGLTVAVPSGVGNTLMSAVMQEYATAKNLKVTSSAGSNAGQTQLLVGDERGQAVAEVSVQEFSAQDAITDVIEGRSDFALVRQALSNEELNKLTKSSDWSTSLRRNTIALDALSFVGHPSNPLDAISIDVLRDVMSGQVKDWSEIGGPNGAISIHTLSDDAELSGMVSASLLGGQSVGGSRQTHETLDDLINAVNNDPLAFAAIYRSQQQDLVGMELTGACNIFYGTSDFSVQTGEYPFPLTWQLFYNPKADSASLASNLIAFLQTDEGQRTLASQGLLSQELRTQAMKDQGDRVLTTALANDFGRAGTTTIERYLSGVSESRRLSTSLRFNSGSSTPDDKALEDIKRISSIVRRPEYANYTVQLVGFSDSYGNFQANLGLSESRASAIRSLLLAENRGWLEADDVKVVGAGPIAPVACNDTNEGRSLNRRVEVWVTPN